MTGTALAPLLRRDRWIVAGALGALTVFSWLYIYRLAAAMGMGGMDPRAMAPAFKPWSLADAAFMAAMWVAMMVGMMVPSVAPMILLYARVGRQAAKQGQPFAASLWFACGYLVAWTGFALVATVAQWALERAALLTPMMASADDLLGGAVLIVAGAYQWTALKDSCLAQCRAPLAFLHRHGGFRADVPGALSLGFRHGLYCVGCCWAAMALLFVFGVMNLLWIAGLAALALVEKLLPGDRLVARLAGIGFLAAGAWLILGTVR